MVLVKVKYRTAPHVIKPMPLPSDLGFDPLRFPAYRPQQHEAIKAGMEGLAKYDIMAIDAPVGSGKSLTNMAIAKLWRKQALASGAEDREAAVVILTATKALADQYKTDFSSIVDMRGMCVGPDTRVLTADLRWVRAGDVKVGQDLAGFEENKRFGFRRRWEKATVVSARVLYRPSYRLEFESGTTIICSAEHRWLTKSNHDGGGNDMWRTTEDMQVGLHHVKRPLDPWEEPNDYNSGWLAAAWDGEGSLSFLRNKCGEGWRGAQLGFVQTTSSPMLEEFKHRITELKLPTTFTTNVMFAGHKKYKQAETLTIAAQRSWLTALGKTRPRRLLSKLDWSKVGGLPSGSDRLVSKVFVGSTRVVALTTTTGTFIAEGLASHNSNYECRALNERFFPADIIKRFRPDPRVRATCDQGPCLMRVECELRNEGCSYFDALRRAKLAPITVTNYAYWLLGALGAVGLVICDEAHLLRSQLDNAAKLEHNDLPRLSFERTKEWALERLRSLDDKMTTIALEREKGVLSKLSQMSGEWVFDAGYAGDDKGRGARPPSWSPVVFHDEGDTLANSGSKFIFTSGTLTEDHVLFFRRSVRAKNLTWDMVSYKSTFPVQNRRVILSVPMAQSGKGVAVKYSMNEADKRAHLEHCIALVKLMEPERRKGIVHGVSYVRAKAFKEALEHAGVPKDLIYFPRFSQETKKAIEDFKARKAGGIIISPSLSTGYDFPLDTCRWQLVLKVPFPDTQSPLMQARQEADKDYGTRIAMETLAQMAGRGSRSQDDWCETYVADASLRWALFRPGAAPRILKENYMEIGLGVDGLKDWLKRRGPGR